MAHMEVYGELGAEITGKWCVHLFGTPLFVFVVHLRVAVKKMKRKFFSWDEALRLREVLALRKLKHPAIVKLKEVIREHDEVFLIFEYMECNLYQLMKTCQGLLPEQLVREWCATIFQGLAYIHEKGYFHRDLKPENLLVRHGEIKIADFGLARDVRQRPPFTDYVSTRWYRAPEVLLRARKYGAPVDMFAMGCILAELITLRPLLPGSSEIDELHKMSALMGPPTMQTWPEGVLLAAGMGFSFNAQQPIPLHLMVPHASPEALDLISRLCQWDPAKRPTALEALQHPFFQVRRPDPVQLTPTLKAAQAQPKQHFNLAAEAGMPADMIAAYLPQRQHLAGQNIPAGVPAATTHRHTSSPGSDESVSTSMPQPPSAAHSAAVDWTPKKGSAAASLADSSASPVSVIPKNTRRRGGAPDLAHSARGQPPADRKQGASMPHPSSRILGALQGGIAHQRPEGSAARIVGPSTKLALLQGFARNLTGPLRLSGGLQLHQQTGETPARAQNALAAQHQPAQQRHAMSQLSPRARPWPFQGAHDAA
ncbi:g7237 [Coccomyxa viridis]|uniref:G7237 protein n=1 Tax=Coccomyxa viridis TaxID=1274662 RepID=A0ABP1FXD7_9CHLO